MRRILLTALLTALGGGVYLAADTAPKPASKTAALMQAKLKAIHSIAEGLVVKDFESIEQSAATLAELSSGSDWRHHGDSVYGDYRDQLHRSSQKVAELARLKNLEGATYGYINLISNCVDCHTHCRDVLHLAEPMPILRPVPDSAHLEEPKLR